MAHQKKYYKDIESAGHSWRLEIWQDIPLDEYGEPTQTLIPVEIGPVLQSLRLVVQGDQASIDTPIVKTSLEMSFIDAPGLEYERKCGYWEEFYTSSAIEYQVKLYKDSTLEWSGYITPDSFAEDLRYRGSVSLIARDNLGTLQDTTFDMLDTPNIDGKVYVGELIQRAMTISTCAMELSWSNDELPKAVGLSNMMDSASGFLMQQMVDVLAFDDKDWWTVLEDVLYALGLVIRYVGGNKLRLMSLRDLPKAGEASWLDVPVKDAQFLAYGRRELAPGIKSIKETIEFDLEKQQDVSEEIEDYVPDQHALLTCQNVLLLGPNTTTTQRTKDIPVHGYKKNRINQYLMPEYSCLLDVSAYEKKAGEHSEEFGQWDDKSIIYYAINGAEERPVVFTRKMYSSEDAISIKLTAAKPVTLTQDLTQVMNLSIDRAASYSKEGNIRYRLKYTDTKTLRTLYYVNNAWTDVDAQSAINSVVIPSHLYAANNIECFTAEVINDLHVPGAGRFEFEIVQVVISVLNLVLTHDCVGLYLRIKDVQINVAISQNANIFDKTTLTTEYSDKYSVRLTRSPELGINPTTAPQVVYIQNAILAEGLSQYYGAEQWVWPHGREILPTTGISLPRLIHQQLLAYHAKPNSVLTGELMDTGGELPDWNSIWMWNGKEHMLMSGSLNVLTGRMEGATLREFTRYEHMWETWVENEDIRVDYELTYVSLWVHSNKNLGPTSWGETIPDWVWTLADSYNEDKKVYEFRIAVQKNTTGQERVARFRIDTAEVRITQRAAGDYNNDYSED